MCFNDDATAVERTAAYVDHQRRPLDNLSTTTLNQQFEKSTSCPLIALPDELLVMIVAYIEDANSLCSLARTCSRLIVFAEDVIWRLVTQLTGQFARELAIAIERRPYRAAALHVLESRCRYASRAGIRALVPVIAQAMNLQELTIESPYCNRAYGNAEDGSWCSTMHAMLRPIVTRSSPHLASGTLTNNRCHSQA